MRPVQIQRVEMREARWGAIIERHKRSLERSSSVETPSLLAVWVGEMLERYIDRLYDL